MTDDDEVETLVVQKVSVHEVAEVRDQLRQLVRIGFIIMLVIVGVQLWGLKQDHEQGNCARDLAEALNTRARFNTQLDDITSKKFELDKELTNGRLPLPDYNREMDKLATKRERTVSERDRTRFSTLEECK